MRRRSPALTRQDGTVNPFRSGRIARSLIAGALAAGMFGTLALGAGPDDVPADTPHPATTAPAPTPAVQPAPADAGKALFPQSFQPAAPLSKPAPSRAQPADSSASGTLTTMAAPLAVVVGAIFLAAIIFRKVMHKGGTLATMMGGGGRAPSGILEVLGRYPISRGQTLVLLKMDQRVLLLSQSHPTRHHPGTFSTLCELADPVDVAAILMKVGETESTGPAGRFNDMLKGFDAEGEVAAHPITRGFRRLTTRFRTEPTIWQEPTAPVAEIELSEPGDLRSLRQQLDAIRRAPAYGGAA